MLIEALNIAINAALILHILMIGVASWRIWRGETAADKLVGVDLMGTLLLAVLILLALLRRDSTFMDIAIALAALGFIATIAYAKYLADEQIF